MAAIAFSEEINQHARGEKFDNVLVIPITQRGVIRSREDSIALMAKGKRILHVGCLDHVPLIRDKMHSGTWFHRILTDCASECRGIDIDQAGIDYVRQEFGIENIIRADLMTGEGCEQFNQE